MEGIVFETALGFVGLVQADPCLLALSFGHSNPRAASRALRQRVRTFSAAAEMAAPQLIDVGNNALAQRICRYALGEPEDFRDIAIAVEGKTRFQQRVLQACRQIPPGETRTYGQLARAAGSPRAARAAGSVMAGNRVPLVVPCHRVVPAGGGLGGFSAPQGIMMKCRLLRLEQGQAAARTA